MTNVNLLPKPGMSLDDIIADTDDGLFLATNRSWSIDDRRLNFQFATELAYEIRGGQLGQLYRNATYTGITPQFWGSCDAIGDASSYVMLGHAQLRQGRADADRPRGPRLLGGAVPRRPGGGDVVSAVEPRRARRLDPSAALALAETVLHQAEAEGATEAEVLVAVGDEALTRFANSEIHQNVAESDIRVSLRFVRGRRVGVASSGRTDHDALRGLAERAGRIAAVAEEAPELAGAAGRRASRAGRGRLRARHGRRLPGAAGGRRAGRDRRGRRGGSGRLRVVLHGRRDGGRRVDHGHPGGRSAHGRAPADGHDGPRRWDRLRGGRRRRRLGDRRRGDRPRGGREGAPLGPCRSTFRPATTRSSWRSTPSPTSSTTSATSASPASPSRRSARSSSPAGGSGASS